MQAQITRTFLYPNEKDLNNNYSEGRIQNPCQITLWKKDDITYGAPDSTNCVGTTTLKSSINYDDFLP